MSLNHLTLNDTDESLDINSWSNIASNSINTGRLTVAQRRAGLTRDDADTSIKLLARGAGYINNPTQSFLYGGLTVKRNETNKLDPDPNFYPILTWDAWNGGGAVGSLNNIYIQNRNKLIATFDDDGLTVNGSITSSGGISQSNISYKNTVSFSNTTTSQAVCSKLLTSQITGAASLNDIFQDDLKVGDSFRFKNNGTWISSGSCNLTYALSTDGNVPAGDTFASGTFPVSVGSDNGSLSYECNFSIKSISGTSATLIQSSRMVYSRSADNIQRISYIDSDTFSVDITDIDFTFALKPSATNLSIEMFSISIEKMK